MKTNEASKALYTLNAAIFRGLHVKMGFDFEKPITIKRIPAPFTIRAACKAIEPDGLNQYNATTAIIMHDSRPGRYDSTPRLVPLHLDGIREDFNHMSYHQYDRQHRYTQIFDDFCRKGDFHELRKAKTCEAFIISQRDEYTHKYHEPVRDWAERQRDMNPGEHEQRTQFYYNKRPTIIIDKSNYRVDMKRDDLKRRAAKLRSEREKAAADLATRNTAADRMNAITEHFNAAKHRIVDAINAAVPTDTAHIDSIDKAIDKYSTGIKWIVFDIERFNANATGNKYSSPDKYNAAFNSIISRLDAIMPTQQPANMVEAAHKTATKGA